jgi:hypothetical protein
VEDVETLGVVIGVPYTKRVELAKQSASDEELREGLVNNFLQTSPYASWEGDSCIMDVMLLCIQYPSHY